MSLNKKRKSNYVQIAACVGTSRERASEILDARGGNGHIYAFSWGWAVYLKLS